MENILKLPYAVFNDWDQLQQFLERKGNPRYELVGDVDLHYRKDIFDLGNLVRVDGGLRLVNTPIKSLGNLEYVGGDLDLRFAPIQSLGNLVRVDGNLGLHVTSIKSLGRLEHVGGYLDLRKTPIKSLGSLEHVGDEFHLSSDHQIPPEQLTKFKDQIKYY